MKGHVLKVLNNTQSLAERVLHGRGGGGVSNPRKSKLKGKELRAGNNKVTLSRELRSSHVEEGGRCIGEEVRLGKTLFAGRKMHLIL